MAQLQNQGLPLATHEPRQKSRRWIRTLSDAIKLLMEIALPIAIGVYTAVTSEQMNKSSEVAALEQHRIAVDRQDFDLERSNKAYQQQLFKDFLDTMYTFHKDGELNDSANPWPFANARYRAVHSEFDPDRKGQALLFFKEKRMIGRRACATGCEEKNLDDIIRLEGLKFDRVKLNSEIGTLSSLDLGCIQFDRISMINASFANVNLKGVSFSNVRLTGAKFDDISANCTRFENMDLDGVDFGQSKLSGVVFKNSNLSTAKLTATQKAEASFVNVIMPGESIFTSPTVVKTATVESTYHGSVISARCTQ